ncbi:MAG: amidophosphoribosyltransferase, partial [Myxococcota bacterium]
MSDPKGVRQQLVDEGVLFQSTMDSELLGHLITRSRCATIEEAVIDATRQIGVAYSLLLMTEDKVIALRDRFGVRPLSFGRMGDGFLVCSENYAMDQYPECTDMQDVLPGEMVVFDVPAGTFERTSYAQADEHFCIFEGIYFSDPR